MAYTMKTNIAKRENYGSVRNTSNIKYIVIHYTGNDGDTDESNAKYFHNKIVKASAHYFVDDDSVTQPVPDNYVAYSVGGSKYSDCASTGGGKLYGTAKNANSISIELCDAVKNGVVYPSNTTIANALVLVKTLMKKYNVPASKVIRHFDVNGKHCPSYWMNDTKWKSEFWSKLSDSVHQPTINTTASTTSSSSTYSKTQFIKDVQSAIGAKVDGIAGNETLSKTVTVSSTKNRKHPVVKAIQKYLNYLGYSCGTADGIAGSKFDSAVKSYQKAKGCIADGEITAKCSTWKKLLGLA